MKKSILRKLRQMSEEILGKEKPDEIVKETVEKVLKETEPKIKKDYKKKKSDK